MQRSERMWRGATALVLPAILGVAAAARVWSIRAGVPHAVGIDEPAILDRALRILNTGDWNPHVFDYPTLVIYLHAVWAIVLFIGGAVHGAWTSLATFEIGAVYVWARLLTAAIGAATVWLTFRIGEAVAGRTAGLLAAAQLAVLPMHVRESHFALTDVPVTALATLAVWLAMRAGRERTAAAYAAAGAACGLAAAAKYNGVVVCVAPAVVWVVHEAGARDRLRTGLAAAGAALGAFLLASPYAVLDSPAFLSGFAAQAARLSVRRAAGDPSWLLYLKHMALMGRFWLPAAAVGLGILLSRRATRTRALPMLAFGAAYGYTLATHGIVFARYALPLLPVVSVLAALPVVETVRLLDRRRRTGAARWALGAGAVALTVPFLVQSVMWIDRVGDPDTRQIAAEWMHAHLPAGARVLVENSGPTYLASLGFAIVPVELVPEHPLAWYRAQGLDYLVISARDIGPDREYPEGRAHRLRGRARPVALGTADPGGTALDRIGSRVVHRPAGRLTSGPPGPAPWR